MAFANENIFSHSLDQTDDENSHLFNTSFLVKLSGYPPEEAFRVIYENLNEFKCLLNSKPASNKCFLIIKIVYRIIGTTSLKEKNIVLHEINNKNFTLHVTRLIFSLKWTKSYKTRLLDFFFDLIGIIEVICNNTKQLKVLNEVHSILQACELILKKISYTHERFIFLRKKCKQLQYDLLEPLFSREDFPEDIDLLDGRENFRTISLYPQKKDLERVGFKVLEKNLVKGYYKNIEHYLNIQFYLLREDFMTPLWRTLNRYKEFQANDSSSELDFESDIRIYNNVRVLRLLNNNSDTGGIAYQIRVKKVDQCSWENAKSLSFGSLVLFTNDCFDSYQLAVVSEREQLTQGLLSVVLVGKEVYGNQFCLDQFVMVEPKPLFPTVYHTLKTLQILDQLPMEKYFLVQDVTPRIPAYMSDISEINIGDYCVNIYDDFTWPDHNLLNMNMSQYSAFKASLRQEFVLVQGPPGTGKSWLSVEIIRCLLNNFSTVTPILILAFTNHALDQVLESSLKFTKKIVRFGSRSQNKTLDGFNFRTIKESLLNTKINWRKEQHDCDKKVPMEYDKSLIDWPKTRDPLLPLLKNEKEKIFCKILIDTEVVKTIENKEGVVNVLYYHKKLNMDDTNQLKTDDDLIVWLLGKPYIAIKTMLNTYGQIVEESNTSDNNISDNPFHSSDYLKNNNQCKKLVSTTNNEKIRSRIPINCNIINIALIHAANCSIQRESDLNNFKSNQEDVKALSNVKIILQACLNSTSGNEKIFNRENKKIDLWNLSLKDRWQLYGKWVLQIKEYVVKRIKILKTKYAKLSIHVKEIREQNDLDLIVALQPHIIGMTTSGAARLHNLLANLAPRIVLVDESAQVLEAHLASSIPISCQHLILIGDHKQLKPSVSTYELAKKCNLNVSMFERMMNNGVLINTLNVQHRMKPNIASLIAPLIYPQLQNDSSVHHYPPINGIPKNLFFVNHTILEKSLIGKKSWCNPHEAEFVIALCHYLMMQGYKTSDVVILTIYSAQHSYLCNLRDKEDLLKDVKVATIDSFQGGEGKIVLLSLVRSNNRKAIGFLEEENRINVALSRAKHGLYIIGNMRNLKAASNLWKEINATLENQQAIGYSLLLECSIHKTRHNVKCGKDFETFKGQCCLKQGNQPSLQMPIRRSLPCGHLTTLPFIPDNYKCLEPCLRTGCRDMVALHPCPFPCHYECGPCIVKVERVLPTCMHKATMECFVDPTTYKCTEKHMRQTIKPSEQHFEDIPGYTLQAHSGVDLPGDILQPQHYEDIPTNSLQEQHYVGNTGDSMQVQHFVDNTGSMQTKHNVYIPGDSLKAQHVVDIPGDNLQAQLFEDSPKDSTHAVHFVDIPGDYVQGLFVDNTRDSMKEHFVDNTGYSLQAQNFKDIYKDSLQAQHSDDIHIDTLLGQHFVDIPGDYKQRLFENNCGDSMKEHFVDNTSSMQAKHNVYIPGDSLNAQHVVDIPGDNMQAHLFEDTPKDSTHTVHFADIPGDNVQGYFVDNTRDSMKEHCVDNTDYSVQAQNFVDNSGDRLQAQHFKDLHKDSLQAQHSDDIHIDSLVAQQFVDIPGDYKQGLFENNAGDSIKKHFVDNTGSMQAKQNVYIPGDNLQKQLFEDTPKDTHVNSLLAQQFVGIPGDYKQGLFVNNTGDSMKEHFVNNTGDSVQAQSFVDNTGDRLQAQHFKDIHKDNLQAQHSDDILIDSLLAQQFLDIPGDYKRGLFVDNTGDSMKGHFVDNTGDSVQAQNVVDNTGDCIQAQHFAVNTGDSMQAQQATLPQQDCRKTVGSSKCICSTIIFIVIIICIVGFSNKMQM